MDGQMKGNDFLVGTLKSKEVGQKLINLLWIELALLGLSFIFSLCRVSIASIYYTHLEVIDGFVALFFVLITLITIILFFIWLYRLHFDLLILFPDYPISPKRALAYLIIPIYNLWGIWHTFATIADYFKDETEPTITHAGEDLYRWVPYLYVAIIVSNTIGRVAVKGVI